VLLEALDFAREGEPWQCAGSKDVRAGNEQAWFIERPGVEDLDRWKSFRRQAYAVATGAAKTEVHATPVIGRTMAIRSERTASYLDPLLQENGFDGERASGGALAHGAVADHDL